jgi:hypothetical protein
MQNGPEYRFFFNPYPANVDNNGELLPMLANGGWDLIQRLKD